MPPGLRCHRVRFGKGNRERRVRRVRCIETGKLPDRHCALPGFEVPKRTIHRIAGGTGGQEVLQQRPINGQCQGCDGIGDRGQRLAITRIGNTFTTALNTSLGNGDFNHLGCHATAPGNCEGGLQRIAALGNRDLHGFGWVKWALTSTDQGIDKAIGSIAERVRGRQTCFIFSSPDCVTGPIF